MYIYIALFYISLAGIVAMILLKRQQVKSGEANIVSRFGEQTDHFFQSIFATTARSISYINKHTAMAIAQWVAFHVLLRVRAVYVEVKHRALVNPHGRKLIDAVRGRGEVRDHGASFYLRRIAADRK